MKVYLRLLLFALYVTDEGVRQRSPISPYLFIITAEILGIAIRRSDDVKGLSTKMQNPSCPNMLMTLN
jgi:hypothetical protein